MPFFTRLPKGRIKKPSDKTRRALQYGKDILEQVSGLSLPQMRDGVGTFSIVGRLPRLQRAIPSAFLDKQVKELNANV